MMCKERIETMDLFTEKIVGFTKKKMNNSKNKNDKDDWLLEPSFKAIIMLILKCQHYVSAT